MQFASVLIVNQQLEQGAMANVALVLGLSAGRCLPDATFGCDVVDASGSTHRQLTAVPHIVRKAGASKLRSLRAEFIKCPDATVIDYPEHASTSSYGEYARALSTRESPSIDYRALYVYAPHDLVQSLTKNLSRL